MTHICDTGNVCSTMRLCIPMKKNCLKNSPENPPDNSPATVCHSPRIQTVAGELHLFNFIYKNSLRTVSGEFQESWFKTVS